MNLNKIATEIVVTGSKTLGMYCSYYVGMTHYKTKIAIDNDKNMFIMHGNKPYQVTKGN